MKLNQITKISTASILITISILYLTSMPSYPSYKEKPKRHLLDKSSIDKVCKRAPKALQDFYTTGDKSLEYEERKMTSSVEPLLKFIETQEIDDLLKYIPRLIPCFIFFIMIVATIIGWFVCCSCCCCPCGCCKKKEEEGCCRTFSFIFTIVMYGGMIAGSIAAFIYSTKFLEGVNATTCSLLKLIDELNEGETINVTPKWIGINGISSTFDKTIGAVNYIKDNAGDAYDKSLLKDEDRVKNFKKLLSDGYDPIKDLKIDDPNDSDITLTIIPYYLPLYGPYDSSENKVLKMIYTEYDVKINNAITEIEKTQGYTTTITTEADKIHDLLEESKTMLTDLSGTFEDNVGSIIDDVSTYLDYVNDYGKIAFYALFGVLLGIAVIALTIMIIYVCDCCQCLKCLLHFIWHLLAFISIFTFLIGSVFVLIGIIGEDGTIVFTYLFSEENLTKDSPILLPNEETLNTCLFGDGDLSKIFDLTGGDNNADSLNSLYQASADIKKAKELIDQNGECIAEKESSVLYNKIANNFRLATEKNIPNDQIKKAFAELNKYTDADPSDSYQKTTTNSRYDNWVGNQEDCPIGYQYLQFGSTTGKKKKCLVLSEWTSATSDYDTLYNGPELKNNPTNGYSTLSDAANAYISQLKKTYDSNKLIINPIVQSNKIIKTEFDDQINQVKDCLTSVEEVINPMINIFGDLVGDNSIFSIVNCSFLQKNIHVFFNSFGTDLGTTSLIFGSIIVAVSFCEVLSILFVLIVIIRYKKTIEKPNESEANEAMAVKVPNEPLDNSNNAAAVENQEIPVNVIDKIDL